MTNCLFFGDSITYGEYDGNFGGWVDILKRYCHKNLMEHKAQEVSVFNLGIGGETTEGLLKRFATEAESRRSSGETLIFFAYGANDLVLREGNAPEVSLSSYIENLTLAVNQALKITQKIFLISILPVSDAVDGVLSPTGKIRTNVRVQKYNNALQGLCHNSSLQYINLYEHFSPHKEQLLSQDGVHPNSEGYQLIANTLQPLLANYF